MVDALSTEPKESKRVLVISLILLLTQAQIPQVMANFIQKPVDISKPEGAIATFGCTAGGVVGVSYLVNNIDFAKVASLGVSISEQIFSGSQITSYLYVQVTKDTNNCSVVCVAFLLNETYLYTPPAYLHVQAPPPAPQNLTASDTGTSYVVLTWSQPNDTELSRDLSYKVSYHNITGTSYNMTCNTTSHNVTDLSPNTTYTMTVMADNGIAGIEENKSLSVTVTTKSATSAAVTTHTSPEMVALVVVMCTVGVMAVVVLVLGLWTRKKFEYKHRRVNEVETSTESTFQRKY